MPMIDLERRVAISVQIAVFSSPMRTHPLRPHWQAYAYRGHLKSLGWGVGEQNFSAQGWRGNLKRVRGLGAMSYLLTGCKSLLESDALPRR